MQKATWMALLTIGLLLSSAGLAEETAPTNTESESLTMATLSVEKLLFESQYAPRWQPYLEVETVTYADDWPRRIADFDFRDRSALARVSKLRGLSLLTLAEYGRSRLFLGVNHNGLLGIHFRAMRRHGDDRYMEVIRMPYLKDSASISMAETQASGTK